MSASHSTLTVAVAAFAAPIVTAPPAIAQQRMGDVVVTASRFPEGRTDTPIGVRVIGADEIAAGAYAGLPDILNKLGGLHIRNNAGTPDHQLDLRGFGITGDQNTLVLLDGVPINEVDGAATRLSAIPVNAIERIEILPGGGAVQYGGGTTGGTINIVTRGPRANERSGTASAMIGSLRTFDTRVTGAYGGERVGLSLAANHLDTENYRRNNAITQTNFMGDVRLLGDGPSLGLKFGVDHQDARFPGALNEAQIRADPRQTFRPNDHGRTDGAFLTLAGATRLGTIELMSDIGWRESRNNAFFDGFGTFSYNESTLRRLTASPRARWSMKSGAADHAVVAGLDLYRWDWDRRSALDSGAIAAPSGQQAANKRGEAAYLQYRLGLASRTQASIGGRLERVEDELRTSVAAQPQTRTQTLPAVEFALRQGITDRWSATARVGTSFRQPHVFENNGTQLLDAQRARSYDIGGEYRANGFTTRLTGYVIRLRNEIYFSPLAPDPLFGFPGANVNLPPTERRGVEWSVEWRALPSLDLAGSMNVQRATFREGLVGGVDVSGKDVPLVPRYHATLRAAWTFLPRTRLLGTWVAVGSQRFDGDQDNSFARSMPRYDIVDLAVAHDTGAWRWSTGVRNLFDRRYFSYGIVFAGATSFSAYPQPDRTFFASAEYRFR